MLLEHAAELSVANAGLDGDRRVGDLDDPIEVLRREQRPGGVGDEAEGVARSERPNEIGARDQLLRLLGRVRPYDVRRRCT